MPPVCRRLGSPHPPGRHPDGARLRTHGRPEASPRPAPQRFEGDTRLTHRPAREHRAGPHRTPPLLPAPHPSEATTAGRVHRGAGISSPGPGPEKPDLDNELTGKRSAQLTATETLGNGAQ